MAAQPTENQQTPGTAIATVPTPAQELVSFVRAEGFKEQIKLALPEQVRPERFIRAAITALMQSPDVIEAERDSILYALVRCAQDGLLPDGREAALVVFNSRGVKKAQYLPMIGGFRKIAAEHGWSLITRVVYENDDFEHVLGLEETIVHRPARPGVDRGDLFAAYAIGKHTDGRRELEVMYREDVEKARAVSRAADRGPWVDWEERMWEKTVGRRLFAKLPLGELDDRVQRVLEASRTEPADAEARMYGAGGELSASSLDVAGPERDRTAGRTDEGHQQAEAAASDPSSAASAPGADDDEPEPGADNDLAAAAGQVRVPDGLNLKKAGKTLAEIAAEGIEGVKWLRWAAEPGRKWNRDDSPHKMTFGDAVVAYVESLPKPKPQEEAA